MKLSCRKCGAAIPFAPQIADTPNPRVVCPGCGTRYRLRARQGRPATGDPTLQSATPSRPPASPPAPSAAPAAASPPPAAMPVSPSFTEQPTLDSGGGTVSPTPGTVFADGQVVAGRYRVRRFIAQGGMGEVYEAEDLELRTTLALKTISGAAADDPKAVERFKREIHLARQVTHPNVCRIFDLGQHQQADGRPPVTFLTMELLAGETLRQRLERLGRLTTDETLPLLQQACAALDAAHAAQVVHRDLKTENLFLVDEHGRTRVVITDFGVARGGAEDRFAALVTGAGIVGTPAYMAPEQVEGGVVTAAADIYAMGVVLYETLTGERPFTGPTPMSVAIKRLKAPPVPPHVHVPDLDPRWERAILRCLERQPERRFATAGELYAA
ncbi:MAG: serine/threonine protein kinase, partial [Acidobacteria bacterium]